VPARLKLATGRGAFADDLSLPGLLHARILRSPHAHARIVSIDTAAARSMPGVVAVFTHEDVPRVAVNPAPVGWPETGPRDAFLLDRKVRYVGDRVAVVAAEDPELAQRAGEAIRIEYELLRPVIDPEAALRPGAPVLHDEPDVEGILDARGNLAALVEAKAGDPARAFQEAERVLEATYRVPAVSASALEPGVALTWLDGDERLVVRSSTEAPFHVRRTLSALLGLPAGRIRVVQPHVGGRFGGKQDVRVEDLCALVTLRTGRPARLVLSGEEELTASPARREAVLRLRAGLRERALTSLELRMVLSAGACAGRALSGLREAGAEALSLYRCPNLRFEGRAAYTNLAPAGGFRGVGAPQAHFALESFVDEIAVAIGEDPLEFRRRHHVKEGDPPSAIAEAIRGGPPLVEANGALTAVIDAGARAIGWERRWKASPRPGSRRRGLGVAIGRHEPGLSGERAAASLRLNEDGSFTLRVSASDVGGGTDALLRQIAARTLAVPVERVVLGSSDTDESPFDPGGRPPAPALAGRAVEKAGEAVRTQLLVAGERLLGVSRDRLALDNGTVRGPEGRALTYSDLCLESLHARAAAPIEASASEEARQSPPAFAAAFAEVEVDAESGLVQIVKLVGAVDAGAPGAPRLVQAQLEGDLVQALGIALHERLPADAEGRVALRSLRDYGLATAIDTPELVAIALAEDGDGPLGRCSPGDLLARAPVAAIANAVAHATGLRLRELPLSPDRVLAALPAERS
jgi:putative selenate reductase molybdopterin-binding subunit